MFARAQNPKIDFFFFYNNNKKIRGTDFYMKKHQEMYSLHIFFFYNNLFPGFNNFFYF